MVTERQMHPDYQALEQSFRKRAGELWTLERELRKKVRSQVELDESQREEQYRKGYQQLENDFQKLSEEFNQEHSKRVAEAEQSLFGPEGTTFAAHLTRLASVPDERLEELMNSARRSGLSDLCRALAHTAQERGRHSLFDRWADSQPGTSRAKAYLDTTPGPEQFDARIRAMRPPRAAPESLVPGHAEHEAARQAEQAERAERRAFFNRGSAGGAPRRVGRRST